MERKEGEQSKLGKLPCLSSSLLSDCISASGGEDSRCSNFVATGEIPAGFRASFGSPKGPSCCRWTPSPSEKEEAFKLPLVCYIILGNSSSQSLSVRTEALIVSDELVGCHRPSMSPPSPSPHVQNPSLCIGDAIVFFSPSTSPAAAMYPSVHPSFFHWLHGLITQVKSLSRRHCL